jgi:hypothetical protein
MYRKKPHHNTTVLLTGPKIMGTQRQWLRTTITTIMPPGVFLATYMNYFCEGKRSQVKLQHHVASNMQPPTSWKPSSMHAPGVKGSYTCQQQPAKPRTMVGPAAWEKTSPLQLLCMHYLFLFFSLFTNVACPLSGKRVEQGPHEGERALLLWLFPCPLGRSSPSFSLSSTSNHPWLLWTTEIWELVPLSLICNPYYKSAQII